MVGLLQSTILYVIPLMMVALAGVFAERSGIINLALEGIMVMGAFFCAIVMRSIQESGIFGELHQLSLIVGMLVSGLAGGVFSLLLSYAAIKWKADQTITGTALNMIAPAIVLLVANLAFQSNRIGLKMDAPSWAMLNVIDKNATGFWADLARIFVNKAYITTYICIVIFVVMSIVLYKTKFGLRLRACGEHPQAADSVGINVAKMRYLGTTISGILAGIGGYVYSFTICNGSSTGSVSGLGFLALAIMIFGNWKPLNIAIVSIFFGLLQCIAAMYGTLDINGDGVCALKNLIDNNPGLSTALYQIIPYVATLIVLAFTSKKSRAPKAEGIPYDKGQR